MKVIRWLDENLEKYVCVVLFMAFTAVMVVNVVMRFVFENAIPWSTELVLFIFVWFAMFAFSYGFKENTHVRVTLVLDKLSQKGLRVMNIICNVIVLVLFIIIFTSAIRLLNHSSVINKTGLLLKYPMWSMYLSLVAGSTLCIFRISQNIYKALKNKAAEAR